MGIYVDRHAVEAQIAQVDALPAHHRVVPPAGSVCRPAAFCGLIGFTPIRDAPFDMIVDLHLRITRFEMHRKSEHEACTAFERPSPAYQQLIRDGGTISARKYADDRAALERVKTQMDLLFGDAEILVQPSAPYEAPLYEEGMGNQIMNPRVHVAGSTCDFHPLRNRTERLAARSATGGEASSRRDIAARRGIVRASF